MITTDTNWYLGLISFFFTHTTTTSETMRKIETLMIDAIRDRRDWQSGNTSVDQTDHGAVVRLFGNVIARVEHEESRVFITDAGWQTATTKSRINAILSVLTNGRGHIYQQRFLWFLTRGDMVHEMVRGDCYCVSM